MSGENRKRVCLTMEEKQWIIKKKDENPNINQPEIALDFASRFDRPITRQCVSRILQKKTKILTSIDPAQSSNLK